MSLKTFLAWIIVGCAAAVIVRESRDRTSQYLAIAVLAVGVLEIIHSRGRFVRFLARLQEAGTVLAFSTLVLGLVLLVRVRDRTFAGILVFAGVLLLVLDLRIVTRL